MLEVLRACGLGLVNEITIAVDAELALEPAHSADTRHVPDGFELLAQRFGSRSNRDSLEAVFATVRAGVRASDSFGAFQIDGAWRHSPLR